MLSIYGVSTLARPRVLIKRELMEKLHELHSHGVPVCTMIKRMAIHGVSAPTLTKLLSYMELRDKAKTQQIRLMIDGSLFPSWVEEGGPIPWASVVVQPGGWVYHGLMPFGYWQRDDGCWSVSCTTDVIEVLE